jgi:Xaa-Pro aminopeptidase
MPAAASSTAGRRDAVRAVLGALEVDAILVTDLLNVRYLTGFTGSNAALLLGADGRDLFCTDGRYVTQSAEEVPDLETVIDRASAPALIRDATGRIGFEALSLTVAGLHQLEPATEAALTETSGVVEAQRAVKDEGEIAVLREACAIADRAFAALLADGGVRPGRTEREVGLDLDQRMRELGAEDPAFETIVAAGPNSAIPHHRPTAAVLAAGDFVKFDFGARFGGYHSDMTRTVVLGEPADWQREIYDLVHAAQAAAAAVCLPGTACKDADAAARTVITDAGYGDRFLHGLGHGVGLEIHEAPSLGPAGAATMAENMVLTDEPGVYLEGRGGVRIEDTGVIRSSGYEVLTLTTKDLVVL